MPARFVPTSRRLSHPAGGVRWLLIPVLLTLWAPSVSAAPSVPVRQIPPAALVELELLENRFELALADDCAADQCYPNGCSYLDHAVADQPRKRSLPGLGEEDGPGSVPTQEYLTRAQCSFSHESSVDAADAAAIVRRLQTRLTQGWTVVTVDHEALPPIPSTVAPVAPPVTPDPAETTTPEPERSAGSELWAELLPHAWWMVGIVLVTLATTMLIWAARRVGRASLEEQALLAQLGQPDAGGAAENEAKQASASPSAEQDADDQAYVRAQAAAWRARLAAVDPARPDPELVALVRDRLRAGDLPLLAKATLRFPEGFPAIFPKDGETAAIKLDLAELVQRVDEAELPNDLQLFRALERHALAATLATQDDTRVVRSLREDFGAAGLVELIGTLPARMGAVLFAVAPAGEQVEAARLLSEAQVAALCQQLLRSNRMDPSEVSGMLSVLRAAPGGPSALPTGITDRGATFDAAGALVVLLPRLDLARRAQLFEEALSRFQGHLPAWHEEIFLAEMLLVLEPEARSDLLLSIEIEALAAWLSTLDPGVANTVRDGMPESLRRSVGAVSLPTARGELLALAGGGRRALARGFQRALARAGIRFEAVVRG